MLRLELAERLRRPLAVPAETEIRPLDDHGRRVRLGDRGDELLRGLAEQLGAGPQRDHFICGGGISATIAAGEPLDALLEGAQAARCRGRPQHRERMGFEAEDDHRAVVAYRLTRGPDQRGVAEVHTVEAPDRDCRPTAHRR